MAGYNDRYHMVCERWIEAISALADGEDPGIDPRLIEAHVTRCSGCRDLRHQLDQLHRPARVRPAAPMPDLSRRIVKLNAIADRASRWAIVRWLLAVVAVVIIGLSVRNLVVAEEHGVSAHSIRHLGAFTLAYGVALLVVVVRPARARTVLPVACTLAAALVITAVVDVAYGHVPMSREAWQHIPEILSVALLWLLAVPWLHRGGRAQLQRHDSPPLRIVDEQPGDVGTDRQAI